MSRHQPSWKLSVLEAERGALALEPRGVLPFRKVPGVGWVLYGGQDVRSQVKRYCFYLQYLEEDKTLRVVAGCRFKTIEQAWAHWTKKSRSAHPTYSNEGKQALTIITLMLLQAQNYGLLTWRELRAKYKVPTPKLPERIKRR